MARPTRELRARGNVWVCAIVLVTSTSSCGRSGYVDPPPPEDPGDGVGAAHARPPLSTINVPMALPLSSLVELVGEAVPRRYGDLDDFSPADDGGRAEVAFELERLPFHAVFVAGTARLSTTVLYRVRVHYSLPLLPDIESSCGIGHGPRPALAVSIESPVSLTSDWSLRTHARVAELRPASSLETDRCKVTGLGIDVTDRIVSDARTFLEEHLADIDSLIEHVDTRSQFASWWNTLREPIELTDSLWLSMEPEAIRRGRILGSGDSLVVQLALQSRPQIVFGDRPRTPSTALPPLDSGAVEPGLDLRIDARAEYTTASRFLQETLAGRWIDMGDHSIQIDSVEVYGIGSGRLAIQLRVSGDLHGRLYLTGTPAIDPTSGEVSVPDLELDVATRDVIFAAASWFTVPELRDDLRDRARWPTAPAIDWLTMWLERGLNRDISDDLRVSGEVDGVSIVSATALEDALWVRVAARGSASMFVGGAGRPAVAVSDSLRPGG